jgi:predicted nuclease of restriction endonuclease-like (RecB) superfamily
MHTEYRKVPLAKMTSSLHSSHNPTWQEAKSPMEKKRGSVPSPRDLQHIAVPPGYNSFLKDLKERVRQAQLRAALTVNRELLALYWYIGKSIVERQQAEGWGNAVIDRLGADLQKAFPGLNGFSRTNVYRMRSFYLAYRDFQANVPQLVGQFDKNALPPPFADLPWGHNVLLIEKVKDRAERIWYGQKAIEHGWSRSVLDHQIDSGLHRRQGKALTNFERTLPPLQSDLAQQTLKDPYCFDFLTLAEDAHERHLERALLEHIRQFLLELGVGFAFVGSQLHLEVGGEDFYIDLLFYHLKLRAFIVIDLKTKPFEPEFAGKMNFYLSAVDELLRHADDKPSIGIILCKSGNQTIAEYALRDIAKPVGVSSYVTRLIETLPADLKSSLPTVAELEAELQSVQEPPPPAKKPRRPKKKP